MRTTCLLLLVLGLFTAGQAQLDTDSLVDVGKTLVNTLVDKGKELLSNAATDLLKSLLSSTSLTDLIGKRDFGKLGDFVSGILKQVNGIVDQATGLASGVFTETMDKLKQLAGNAQAAVGTLADASGVNAAIDSLVAEHHSRQKRLIGDLVEQAKALLSGAVDKAKELASTLKEHASNLVSSALQKGVDVFGKRDLSDHLKTIGDALSSAVSPFSDIVSGLGTTLQGHFSNLIDTVKGHADALGTKLQPHLDELKGHGQTLLEHGKNALGALSEVVGDILNQTVENASDSLSGVAGTVQNAGKTVVDHFAGGN